ncbi:MAG: imidazolonepropionase [Candidatus Eremiobacteraeota bacterium]|nr:imidazolonepropionase [Candidatus Eremiobacteraeota bacterium]
MVPNGDAYGSIRDGALAARDGSIAWIGRREELPAAPELLARTVVDAGGRWITPGLVDPHTHLIFGGERLRDFERRIAGGSYATASGAEAGIAHTVASTRAATDDELYASARRRLLALAASGVTTVEIKSGYGLDMETELRMLRVARRLGDELQIDVRTTYLGAHVVPPEFAGRREAYLDLVCETVIPRVASEGLADAVDVFCDSIAFAPSEANRIFEAAAALGLPVKMHADQLSDCVGAALAARHGALSADHLEYASEAGIEALAAAGTVATVLPGAYYYLHEQRKPPIASLRKCGVPIALASDCNPGTSPIASLTTAMNMACVLFDLSPAEALRGSMRNAARALGLGDRGELRTGWRCDLALWDVASPAELCYWLGLPSCAGVVIAGRPFGTGRARSPGGVRGALA